MEKKRPSPNPQPLELDLDDEFHSSARQTVMPEFDVEAYAREQMAAPDSEVRMVTPADTAHGVATVPPMPTVSSSEQALMDMRAYLSELDFSAALVVAESLLEEDKGNAEAKECVRQCHAALQDVYLRRIGSLNQVPILALSRSALREAALDHRAGFLLSLMDGVSTLEMIHDVSGMSMLEVLRVVLSLVQQGVITLT